ncbi:cytochrome b [Snodgrassella sp. CFCC 13594]|uniref:cytochrome b n=1 Tax=Snodgrassella sp. CFCC 13594 TaxID=1775559 RepID=UPI00082B36C0|nr:cytochrome b [Snodgrassella sp. CFCC 13594]
MTNQYNHIPRYTTTARILHWLMAAIFIVAWLIGFYSTEFMSYGDGGSRGAVITLHKNIASTILFLVVIRIFWRYTHPAPALPENMSPLMQKMAHGAHHLLYLLLVLVPISGCVFSWSAGHPVPVLYLFNIPQLVQANPSIVAWARPVHEWLALFAGLVVVVHLLAALKHHFIDKDSVLLSMLPERKQR